MRCISTLWQGVSGLEGPHYLNPGLSLLATSPYFTDGLVTEPELKFKLRSLQMEIAWPRTHTCCIGKTQGQEYQAHSYRLPMSLLSSHELQPRAGRGHMEPGRCPQRMAESLIAFVYLVHPEYLVPHRSHVYIYSGRRCHYNVAS